MLLDTHLILIMLSLSFAKKQKMLEWTSFESLTVLITCPIFWLEWKLQEQLEESLKEPFLTPETSLIPVEQSITWTTTLSCQMKLLRQALMFSASKTWQVY